MSQQCNKPFCTEDAIRQCYRCLKKWCHEDLYHQETKGFQFKCGDPFPCDACPACYGDYYTTTVLWLFQVRFSYLCNRIVLHTANEKEMFEYETWIKPLRTREKEETSHMTRKEKANWKLENFTEEELKKNFHSYTPQELSFYLIDPNKKDSSNYPFYKDIKWGVTCYRCVYDHYVVLWKRNSGIDMITISRSAPMYLSKEEQSK